MFVFEWDSDNIEQDYPKQLHAGLHFFKNSQTHVNEYFWLPNESNFDSWDLNNIKQWYKFKKTAKCIKNYKFKTDKDKKSLDYNIMLQDKINFYKYYYNELDKTEIKVDQDLCKSIKCVLKQVVIFIGARYFMLQIKSPSYIYKYFFLKLNLRF